jgi:osmoprotectant transport system permease protein
VKEESKKQYDIDWLQPLGFSNTYALMMRQSQARKSNLKTISNLKDFIANLNE